MKYINIAYDYEYDDDDNLIDMGTVDVVLVPDYVHDNLGEIARQFNYWVGDEVYFGDKKKHPEYWAQLENGKVCMNVGTEHFVNWLNDNYFHCEHQKCKIVAIEAEYNPQYPTAKF